MLLSSPVVASPHTNSLSHSHPPSPSLMSSAASVPTTRSVLRRYQQHIAEQPPTAASHKHSGSTQSASSHARPPVHPGHHISSSLPVQPGNIPAGLVRMRLSQYLAMCEAHAPQNESSRLSLPNSPRLAASSPSSPRPPHRSHAPLSPTSYSSTSPAMGASPAALTSVTAIIAALNSQTQRPPDVSTLSAQQQLAVAGRVRSLAKAYTELQRQHQQEKERDRVRQHGQRTAHKQNKRPAPAAHNSVLAAVPNSRISLRRRHSDSRMHPPATAVSSHPGNVSPQPARTHRTFPRSSLTRPSQPSSSASIAALSSLPPRSTRSQPVPRIRFRRSCLVRQYSRCQAGSSGVPRNGGVSLGLGWVVVKQQSVKLRRDHARAAAGEDETDEQQDEQRVSRRYPSQNVNEELPRLSERERREVLEVEDETSRDELLRERAELDEIRRSRQSNFCNCKPVRRSREEELDDNDDDDDGSSSQTQCCTDVSCPCVRDGIGCHVEGNHYCQCNLSSSSSSSRPPSCGNPHGLFRFDEYSVRQHAMDILYPSYEPHSVSFSHSRDDSGGAGISTPSSLSPSLSSPSSTVRLGGMSGLRSASFSFHPSGAPMSLLSSLSYSSASGSGGLWDMGVTGTHTPRALLRRPSRVSPPTSPLFVQSGRSSTATVMHRATG